MRTQADAGTVWVIAPEEGRINADVSRISLGGGSWTVLHVATNLEPSAICVHGFHVCMGFVPVDAHQPPRATQTWFRESLDRGCFYYYTVTAFQRSGGWSVG